MRIVTQCRRMSINFDTSDIYITGCRIMADVGKSSDIILGEYADDSFAKIVFADMHKLYLSKPDKYVFYMPES